VLVGVWGAGLPPNPHHPNPKTPIPNPQRVYNLRIIQNLYILKNIKLNYKFN